MFFLGLLAGILAVTTAQFGVVKKYLDVDSILSYVISFVIWSVIIFSIRELYRKVMKA
jgi:hypothetical protein